jgi:hypothetical protein
MGVAEVARLLARTLASPATRQIIMDRALGFADVDGLGEHANDNSFNIRVAERCTPHESLSPSWLLLSHWSTRVAHAVITLIPAAKCPTAIVPPLRFPTGNIATARRALRANTGKRMEVVCLPMKLATASKRRHHPSRQPEKTATKQNDGDPVCLHS